MHNALNRLPQAGRTAAPELRHPRRKMGEPAPPSPFLDGHAGSGPTCSQDWYNQLLKTLQCNSTILTQRVGEQIPPPRSFNTVFGSSSARAVDEAGVLRSAEMSSHGDIVRSPVGLPPLLLLLASASLSSPSGSPTFFQTSSQRSLVVELPLPTTPKLTAPPCFPGAVSGQKRSGQGAPGASLTFTFTCPPTISAPARSVPTPYQPDQHLLPHLCSG